MQGLEAPLANAVHLLHVSPLKALNNDIQRNLEGPLAELQQRFGAAGERFPEIRVGVRTGDTPPAARAHLGLTLERLEQLAARPPQRIGLSATQKPLEEVARFLGGVFEDGKPAAD